MRGTTISIFLLIIQMLLFNQDSAFSCSCVGPNTFFKSVNKHVLEVKFLNYDTIWFKSGTTLSEYSVTMVEVIENIGSDVNSDTIPILVDKGFECFQSLKIKNEYKSYIITGSMDKMFLTTDTTINFVETEVMVLGLCTEPQVFVDIDGKVSGNLTLTLLMRDYLPVIMLQ